MKIYKFAIITLAIILLLSIFAPLISPYDPIKVDMTNALTPPCTKHLLGTDALGRDVLSRLLYGGRSSILLSIVASIVTMALGFIIGILSGYYGGKLDFFIQIMVNILQSIPSMSFMIAIIGIMGSGIKSILLSVVITSWAGFSRIVRSEVLSIREEDYIEGAKAIGAMDFYIIIHHIIPNIIGPFIVLFTVRIGKVILSIASLSFLGLGLKPPIPDWGIMISDAKSYYLSHPILIIAPGAAIMLLSLSINIIGDFAQDYLDIEKNIHNMAYEIK
ncbi:ABC transporter permease [Clostridium botulinum]|uniref:ABC transporter permease n=1 Tax=Clostridium botulinum TaxID=1491 RepID=A0A846J1J1_CLOBO|nr:ABC transporter permease [Clostridium botulinum]ACA56959.1 glutathione transport system permease protein GsiD [Clostridium botulinum A3 str. Loch Maree]NFH64271.1 ABC transporter permease [Clostridium botulinum]NFJ07150.1 ABC transporter permease [Clostridium botulinum]NFK14122.1 ABC transporter permease [Clostridium botulinum]NFM92222.1 ABC transporter permease [Clostridium botulinum]